MEIALVIAFFAAWAGWAVAGFALIDRRYYKRISGIHKDSARFWEGASEEVSGVLAERNGEEE